MCAPVEGGRALNPASGPRAGRAQRSGLSREQVAAAALYFVDHHGLEALTMRRLGESLGVGTMTLYGYFRSKDELLDAVVDAAVVGPEALAVEGPWRHQLGELIRRARRNLTLHPAIVHIRVRQPVLRPDALVFAERGLGILHDAGFAHPEAARAFRLLFTYTMGFAAFSPEATADAARRDARIAIASLPAEEYPALTAAGDAAAEAMAGDEQFEYGLERILDGLEASLRAT